MNDYLANDRADAHARWISRVLGAIVTGLGVVVLIGWSTQIVALKAVLPGAVTMKANAAIGFLLTGLALSQKRAAVSRILAACLLALGTLTLAQDLFAIDLHLDQLVFPEDAAAHETGSPGRMSPATAIGFALLGLSILSLRNAWVSQLAAALAGLAGAAAFVGYLYGIEPLRGVASMTTMALHTSLGLMAAAGGALFARGDAGLAAVFLDDAEPGRQLRLFFPVAIVLPLALGTIAIAGGEAGFWDVEYQTVILSLSTIGSLCLFALLAYRSFRRSDVERMAALASLTASEDRYRRTFEHVSIGIAHLTGDGRWIRVNQRLCEILGYDAAELLEKTYTEVSHLDDLDLDVKQWELLRRGEISDYGVERRFVTKEGEIVFADVRVVREDDEVGDLQHFIVVVQDITGRKLSEGTLRMHQRALAATQNGVVIADATQDDAPIIYMNPAFLEMTGCEPADLIGQNCRFLNRLARDQAALDVVRKAIAKGEDCSVLLRNHRKDGTPFWNQLSIAPVHDDDDVLTHYIGIAIDATDRVEAIAEREELLRGAEEANQEKDRFLSVVSHEMRSPMNAILAWASILVEEGEDEEVVRAANAISASVRSQARLVDDLLEVSRMRAGTLDIQSTAIELSSTIDEIVAQLIPVAEERGIELDWRRPAAPVSGWADPERVGQILRNLIDNSLKFTPAEGQIRIELVAGSDEVEIEVQDSGRGIARDALERVFDNFWQGDRKGGSGGKGLGLGLPIVRYLVEAQGGTIVADSAGEGQGATFRVRLPRRPLGDAETPGESRPPVANSDSSSTTSRTPATAGPPGESAGADSPGAARDASGPAAAAAGPERPTIDLTGLEIVVVDDDVPTVEASASVLSQAGAIVRRAHTVSEALRHFERAAPDILVSDIGLPDRDGMDLIRAVRAMSPPQDQVLALAVTGFADEPERRRIQRAGFDAYLSKPVAPGVILERVAELWRLEQAAAPAFRRVLLVRGSSSRVASIASAIEVDGHTLREVEKDDELARQARDFEPEVIFVSSRLDGADAGALGERLRAMSPSAVLVAIVEGDDQVDLYPYDHLLTHPGPAHALRRLLRIIEVSKWAK